MDSPPTTKNEPLNGTRNLPVTLTTRIKTHIAATFTSKALTTCSQGHPRRPRLRPPGEGRRSCCSAPRGWSPRPGLPGGPPLGKRVLGCGGARGVLGLASWLSGGASGCGSLGVREPPAHGAVAQRPRPRGTLKPAARPAARRRPLLLLPSFLPRSRPRLTGRSAAAARQEQADCSATWRVTGEGPATAATYPDAPRGGGARGRDPIGQRARRRPLP